MPLNFKFVDSINRELIEYTNSDGELHWHPRAQSFVFYQMLLQFNLTGEMTTKKLIEIDRRIRLLDLISKYPNWYDENGNGYSIQLADIITYWGLQTNVGHLDKRQWNAYYNRLIRREAGFTPVKQLTNNELKITHPADAKSS